MYNRLSTAISIGAMSDEFVRDFVGKVAFVTGAASGMGRATADLLAKRGADVAMVDLRLETVKQAADEVAKSYGVKTLAIAVDVASYDQVEKAVQATVEGLGGLHCAFNAAGLPGREGPGYMLADYPVESWSRMINVNCDGVFYCCKAQISHFMKTGTKGSIVNVSSTAAERVFPACAAYVTAKAAVRALTQCAGVEYSRFGIRTNAIAPGYTDTRMMDQAGNGDAVREYARKQTPLNRLGKPEEMAEFAVFLLSDKASFITGAYLPIDGGFLGAKPGPFPWEDKLGYE